MVKYSDISYFIKYLKNRKNINILMNTPMENWSTNVFNDTDKENFYFIEHLRQSLKNDKTLVPYFDLGAPSKHSLNLQRSIAAICKSSAQPAKYARLLYRVASQINAKNILELGTSLGISTAYLAQSAAHVFTIEGHKSIANIAKKNFSSLAITNISQRVGYFDHILPEVLAEMQHIDLVYIDGNHQYEPTLHYFEMIKPFLNKKSIVILDDIYWSHEMARAWEKIKADPMTTCSIDIFKLGFVFFEPNLQSTNLVLSY